MSDTRDIAAPVCVRSQAWLTSMAGVVGFCLLVGAAAQVRIALPGTDVPMTLQPLAVLLAGLTLAPGWAVSAMILYLSCGALGVPVFAFGSGALMGPTGGYLVGFVGAAAIVGMLKGRARAGVFRMMLACLVGMLVLFAAGVAWRTVWLGGNAAQALWTGLVPFAAKAAVEIMLAPVVVAAVRTPLNRS